MSEFDYEVIARNFKSTTEIDKELDLFYRCVECKSIIPSVPSDNIGCGCGNIFIDKDYWRLIVADLSKIAVVRRKSN